MLFYGKLAWSLHSRNSSEITALESMNLCRRVIRRFVRCSVTFYEQCASCWCAIMGEHRVMMELGSLSKACTSTDLAMLSVVEDDVLSRYWEEWAGKDIIPEYSGMTFATSARFITMFLVWIPPDNALSTPCFCKNGAAAAEYSRLWGCCLASLLGGLGKTFLIFSLLYKSRISQV